MYLCLYLSSIYAHHYIHISLPVFSASTSNLAIICLSVSNLYSSIYIINVCIPMVIYLYNYHLSIHPSTYLCIIYIYCLSISVIICLLSIVHPSIFLSFVCLYLFIYLSVICLSTCLSVTSICIYLLCLLLFLSMYPPIYLSSLSICIYHLHVYYYHLPTCLSLHPPHLPICRLSVSVTYLHTSPSVHPPSCDTGLLTKVSQWRTMPTKPGSAGGLGASVTHPRPRSVMVVLDTAQVGPFPEVPLYSSLEVFALQRGESSREVYGVT